MTTTTHHDHLDSEVAPGGTCPKCKRKVPLPHKEGVPKDTKQINLAAPTEEMEAFLTLLEECRVLLERPETTRWKFYTMLEVLYHFNTNFRKDG